MIRVKKESEITGLKLSIPRSWHLWDAVTSWHFMAHLSLHGKWMGKIVETVTDFIFLGSRITADSDCNHEIKRHLLLGRKVMTILKSRDITLLTKFCLVKAMVFPVVMYRY